MLICGLIFLATAAAAAAGTVFEGVERSVNNSGEMSSCPYAQVGDQCLFFVTFQKDTRDDAQVLCRGLGGNLVMIKTATQLKAIMDYLYSEGDATKIYWIDGMFNNQTGRFTYSSDEAVPMGTPFWAARYGSQEPTGDGLCTDLYINEHHYMNDAPCNKIYYPVCEFPASTGDVGNPEVQQVECEGTFTAVGSKCLFFLTHEYLSWVEASVGCSLLGGELAIIDDIEDLRAIYLHIHNNGMSSDSFWLAGSDVVEEDVWYWADGRRVPMSSPFWGCTSHAPYIEPDFNSTLNCLGLQAKGAHYFRAVECQTLQFSLCMAS